MNLNEVIVVLEGLPWVLAGCTILVIMSWLAGYGYDSYDNSDFWFRVFKGFIRMVVLAVILYLSHLVGLWVRTFGG